MARTRLLCLACVAGVIAGSALPAELGGRDAGRDPALSELSALADTADGSGQAWGVNDSGSFPRLYRMGADGAAIGRVWVHGTELLHNDWEALARYRADGRDWLLIGDIGDNRERRDHVHVYAVPEPAPGQTEVDVAWQVDFRYPDGPRDAEGMVVDADSGDLLVLTKRERPQRLYRVALDRADGGVREARPVSAVRAAPGLDLPAPPTELALSGDGRTLVVLTYRGLFLWRRGAGEDWAATLAGPGEAVPFEHQPKSEAMLVRGDVATVASERDDSPWRRVPLPAAAPAEPPRRPHHHPAAPDQRTGA